MKTVTIEITSEDIAQGRKNIKNNLWRATHCPVAIAARRVLCHRKLQVLTHEIVYGLFGYRHSEKLERWIRSFDDGLSVRPFSFKVTL